MYAQTTVSHLRIVGQVHDVAASSAGVAEVQRKMAWLFIKAAPFFGALAACVLVLALLATMYFTWFSLEWTTFLSGILIAAVLSVASRSARAEWMIARRTAQLVREREKSARESRLRARAEAAASGAARAEQLLNETLPLMFVRFGTDLAASEHNRHFRVWLGLSSSQILNHPLSAVLGASRYALFQQDVQSSLAGQPAFREQVVTSPKGEQSRLLVQCLPEFSDAGAVTGAYLLLTEVSAKGKAQSSQKKATNEARAPVGCTVIPLVRSTSEEVSRSEALLKTEIEHDEFCLYVQSMQPVVPHEGADRFHEILVRYKAEEESLSAPGLFVPMAEQNGVMPLLDKWAIRDLLKWIAEDESRRRGLYSLNISFDTLNDSRFTSFVEEQLVANSVPGTTLCFEIQESDISRDPAAIAQRILKLKGAGCKFAICGFGGKRVSADLLKLLQVDFVKIDGSLILRMANSPVDLARVRGMRNLAQSIGVRTIAECVEDNNTLAKLRSIGVDYMQGTGVSRPKPLRESGKPSRRDDSLAAVVPLRIAA